MSAPRGQVDRFAVPDSTYLLSHSVGLLPHVSRDATARYFDVWTTDPAEAWPTWLGEIDRFRTALGALLGGSASSFCPQSNVSSGLTKVLGALRALLESASRDRPTILISEEAFPSLGFVCQRADYDVRFIPRQDDVLDIDVWSRHLHDVDIVLVTHVHSNTGQLVPVAEVAALARARSVVSIVDVAQSVGVIPIDLDAWGADVVLGSCVKWLCGGPGAGWLWVDSDLLWRCEPIDVGWFSHEDPFEFDIHRFRDAPGALRFLGGTPAVLPAIVAATSIELFTEVGIDAVRRHNLELTQRLIDALGPMVVSPRPATERGGTVIVDPGPSTDDVLQRLAAHAVLVDQRPNGLRISPHIYNSADDLDRAIEVIVG